MKIKGKFKEKSVKMSLKWKKSKKSSKFQPKSQKSMKTKGKFEEKACLKRKFEQENFKISIQITKIYQNLLNPQQFSVLKSTTVSINI